MKKTNKRSSRAAGLGLFKIPDNYEKMTIEEQQQVLTDLMREVGKRMPKTD